MSSFRKFIEQEGVAAPTMGAGGNSPTPPGDDDNVNYDTSVGDREFDISPGEKNTIDLHGQFITSYEPLIIPGHGVIASAPIQLQILQKFPDGSAKVKVMYSLTNHQKLMNWDRTKHKGPIEDKIAFLSKKQLDKIQLKPFNMGAAMGGMGAMGGGVPPAPGMDMSGGLPMGGM